MCGRRGRGEMKGSGLKPTAAPSGRRAGSGTTKARARPWMTRFSWRTATARLGLLHARRHMEPEPAPRRCYRVPEYDGGDLRLGASRSMKPRLGGVRMVRPQLFRWKALRRRSTWHYSRQCGPRPRGLPLPSRTLQGSPRLFAFAPSPELPNVNLDTTRLCNSPQRSDWI